MGEKLVVGPINKGLRNDRTAFVIDNDSFPTLVNAYQWRGRVKRKRGTSLLGRLQRYFNSLSASYSATATITLDGGGNGNLITGFGLQTNASIVPAFGGYAATVTSSTPITYTDNGNGTLSPSGTINYATGAITIAAAAGLAVSATFLYYPDIPVMGLEDLILGGAQFPGTLAFDTTYSYNIQTVSPYAIYDVSFYANPPSATYPGYIHKAVVTPTSWNGQDYQQVWSTNYQGALWATNGITVPFTTTNIGMQFNRITNVSAIVGGPPATAQLTIAAHGLVVGDFLFINEIPGGVVTGINFQTGYVITVVDANNVVVEFPNATLAGAGGAAATGIAQYLTNRSNPTLDCLRWYDGDPTNGNPTNPTLNGNNGWVNFAPPLSQLVFSIADLPAAQYYLVGARMVLPYKDRLLFFGPVIQTSTPGSQVYLQDTVIYSQNGAAFYTASFTGDPGLSNTVFHPILVPPNQTATPNSYWEDQTGFGGFLSAGLDQAINTVAPNEDVLIVGFSAQQARLVYTGNDLLPFNFFTINSELGSSSIFSSVIFDDGIMARGARGFTITSQVGTRRVDLDIPDQVFQISLLNNGTERITAQRDFISEWVYFTYGAGNVAYSYPNQTLQYNYRDQSWAIFNECYTTYGSFRKQTGYTWATIGMVYPTWESWNDPWSSGPSTLLQPQVVGGNQQGFVLIRDDGTDEGNSIYIQNISVTTVTSPNHCLNTGDYIVISGVLGTMESQVNGKIYSVGVTTPNTFLLNPGTTITGTYIGGGVIKRMYVPSIKTKQFPISWDMGRKTRIGVQQYLFSFTPNGQITLLIFLSQSSKVAYNNLEFPSPVDIVPSPNSQNNSLIYSTVLYTCPESTNLGLTPANTNLQMPTAQQQQQIWHRMNTSLLGDTIQIGFSLNDTQMRDTTFSSQFAEIEFHSMILDINPSSLLA